MGIIISGGSVILGGLLGACLKHYIKKGNLSVLGIVIMLMSLVGVLENLLGIEGGAVKSTELPTVLFSLLVGGMLGETLKIEERLNRIPSERFVGSVINGSLFFGVGALQITGPISMVLLHDHSQLMLKAMIDFPFAITFGATYGLGIALSGIPVMLMQVGIAAIVYFARGFFDAELVAQISALGYVVLFLMGLNLSGIGRRKINPLNLLPSIAILLLWQGIRRVL